MRTESLPLAAILNKPRKNDFKRLRFEDPETDGVQVKKKLK